MDTIPEEFLTGAQPLAYVVGTVPRIENAANKLVEVVSESCNDAESIKAVRFTVVESYDYIFHSKKAGSTSSLSSSNFPLSPLPTPSSPLPGGVTQPTNAHHSLPSPSASVSTSSSSAQAGGGGDGILKANWLHKHHALLPSVVLMVYEFGLEWSSEQFLETQGLVAEAYSRIKAQISGRDCKIVLILLKTGITTAENATYEERFQSIRKKCNLDSKFIFNLAEQDITLPLGAQSTKSRQLGKTIRELSNTYYKYHRKIFKRLDKLGSKITQPLRYARYNIKAAIYCDFVGQTDTSLKHLQDSYYAMTNFYDTIRPIDIDQVETVSSWLNYRICRILLYTASSQEVSQQFRSHLNLLGKNYRGLNEWKHYRWLAEQYLIHEALIHTHPATSPPHTDRVYYYLNAAQNISKSFAALQVAIKTKNIIVPSAGKTLSKSLEEELLSVCPSGWTVVGAEYCSGMPYLKDTNSVQTKSLDENGIAVVSSYEIKMEALRDPTHSTVILTYLNKALQGCVDASSSANAAATKRQQAYIESLMGEQHLIDLRYDLALPRLRPLCTQVVASGWKGMAVALLRKVIGCAIHLDDYSTYIHCGLSLCASLSTNFSDEKRALSKDIWSALTALKDPSSLGELKKSFHHFKTFPTPPSYVPLAVDPRAFPSSTPQKKLDDLAYPVVLSSSSKAPLFATDVQFSMSPPSCSPTSCSLGTDLICKLTLSSLIDADISFAEMHVYFTNCAIVHKFTHIEEVQSVIAPTDVPSEGLTTATPVSSDSRYTYFQQRSLSFTFNEKKVYVMRSEINGNILKCIDGDVLSIAKVVLFVTPPPVNFAAPLSSSVPEQNLSPPPLSSTSVASDAATIVPTSLSDSYEGCTTVLELFTPSKMFLDITSSVPNTLKLVDMKDAAGDYAPAFVQIEGPQSKLTLNSPLQEEILQGIIQRVDLRLCSNGDAIKNGSVEFSTDLVPRTLDASLLWYPELSSSCEGLTDLDKLIFHPLSLSTATTTSITMDDDLSSGADKDKNKNKDKDNDIKNETPTITPAAFALPDLPPNSDFTVPIFVRSEALGMFKVKASFKYSPTSSSSSNSTFDSDVSTSVTKAFEITCNVVRPLAVSFNLSSNRDANCGVSNDMASNSVLRGDNISLTSTITCVRVCKKKVGVIDIALIQSSDGKSSFKIKDGDKINESKGIEVRSESKETASEAASLSSSSPITLLSHEESFSSCVDVLCLTEVNTSKKPQLPVASTSSTIGTLSLQWRLEDTSLLFPTSTPPASSLNSLDDIYRHSNILPFVENSEETVSKKVSYTRVCVMNFAVPSVQVIDAPFDVSLDAPSTLLYGETATITIRLFNKLLSSERISVSCDTVDYILMSGFVKSVINVSPKSSSQLQFSLMPLQYGQLRLPKIKLFWERHNLSIMEIGGSGSGSSRAIYVIPKGVEEQK